MIDSTVKLGEISTGQCDYCWWTSRGTCGAVKVREVDDVIICKVCFNTCFNSDIKGRKENEDEDED